jgi:ABC-type branched-subunit amino acid transport system ATPase component
MLELRDIHFRYSAGCVLQGLSIEVGEGEIVALLGPLRTKSTWRLNSRTASPC